MAAFSALVAAVSWGAKLIAAGISAWWLQRSAIIRFYNDVEIWIQDVRPLLTAGEFNRLADAILQAPRDFRFQIPISGEADTKEIMKYIHWLRPPEIKAIRSYMMLDDLYESISFTLGSEAFAKFSRKRKISAVAERFNIGLDTFAAAKLSTGLLSSRFTYLQTDQAETKARLEDHANDEVAKAALKNAIRERLNTV
ncbi:hypothetical protein [Pararhizobium sp. O133]|uniref:hypothetical protein n=1 Tax=Pararhizobium sp. O133 TaxID=3449278 RepID=UPI003F68931C